MPVHHTHPNRTVETVTPTPAELAAWHRRHGRKPPPSMVRCLTCDARLWGIGLRIASHRRSKGHRWLAEGRSRP